MKSQKPNTQSSSITLSTQTTNLYSGPIPNPESLEKYEQILPGAADRILKMAELEQKSRLENNSKLIEIESKSLDFEYKNFRRGQVFALSSVFVIVGFCVWIIYQGYASYGRDIAIAVIVALAGTFVIGRSLLKKKISKEDNIH
ncbi:MAG: DUF2335 domain-containing protein [Cytophagales bacterium]